MTTTQATYPYRILPADGDTRHTRETRLDYETDLDGVRWLTQNDPLRRFEGTITTTVYTTESGAYIAVTTGTDADNALREYFLTVITTA